MLSLKTCSSLVALFLMVSVRAETNVTIDDTDPQIVYQPPGVWSFQGDTSLTQDRWNKTTHYTSELGATASLTFTGALHVYYIGYGIMQMPPPAFVPITLQPKHGSAIAVQSDSYRPAGAQAQITLFSSSRLDPTETYTITVTKTNATLVHGVNIDSFILTQPDKAGASPDQTSISSDSPARASSTANTENSNASPNTGTIVGGAVGGIVVGIIIAFLIFRWLLKRNRRRLVGPDGLPIPYTEETARPPYSAAPPPYPSKHSNFSPQATIPEVTAHHSVSTPIGANPLTSARTSSGQRSVAYGHTGMVQVQEALPYTPLVHGKAQYMGNSQHSSGGSVSLPPSHVAPSSPEDMETMLPAYSRR